MRNDRPGPYTSWMTRQGAASEVSARVWERISMTPRKEGSKPYLCRSSAWRRIDVWSRIYWLHSGKSQKRHEEKWIKKYHNYSMCSEILGDVLALYKHCLTRSNKLWTPTIQRFLKNPHSCHKKKVPIFPNSPCILAASPVKVFASEVQIPHAGHVPRASCEASYTLQMGDGPGPLLIAHAMLHNGQWTVSCVTDFYDSRATSSNPFWQTWRYGLKYLGPYLPRCSRWNSGSA